MAPPPTSIRSSSSSSGNNISKSKKRKRQQPQPQQYGLDHLPEIPGIPMEIVPLHVHALQSCTAYFHDSCAAKERAVVAEDTSFACRDPAALSLSNEPHQIQRRDTEHDGGPPAASSVLDSVLQRMDQAQQQQQNNNTNDGTAISAHQHERDLLQRRDQAVNSWLQAIHRWLRNHKKRQQNKTETQDPNTASMAPEQPEEVDGVLVENQHQLPVAVLQHLLELTLSRRKISGRRAMTYLLGHLLLKSAAARQSFVAAAEQTVNSSSNRKNNNLNMLDWMDAVANPTANNNNNNNYSLLWQQEAHALLKLLDQNYSDLYPTLTTAVLRLEQLCPDLLILSNTTDSHSQPSPSQHQQHSSSTVLSVPERRRLRDTALRHAAREARAVTKLVQRASQCTEILVPRIAVADDPNDDGDGSVHPAEDAKPAATSAPMKGDDDDGDDDDGESDVDWEDGWENDTEQEDNKVQLLAQQQQQQQQHAQAVEDTLAAMASAGGLTAGELSIDMSAAAAEDRHNRTIAINNSNNDEQTKLARDRFTKVVKILSERHQPRLGAWVDALTTADELVLASSCAALSVEHGNSKNTMALVRMSSEQRRKRSAVLRRMRECQQQVERVLTQARHLGLLTMDKDGDVGENGTTTDITNSSQAATAAHAQAISATASETTMGSRATSSHAAETTLTTTHTGSSNGQERRRLNLETSSLDNRARQRRGQSHRNHQRIQIKYRKNL